MAPFRFRFQTLLNMRVSERAQKQGDLAKALEAMDVLERQELELEREATQLVESSRAVIQPGAMDVDAVVRIQRHRLILKASVDQLRKRKSDVKAEVDRRRSVLVEADRQVRVMEKLAEKLETAHTTEELAREQKLMDELAVLRSFSRRGAYE
ncbi:flagellar export protein FliJ [Pirellula staleyi DSM 6068]|uniref:Flagellar FliJ protein n=1 Tax=Pirellula staleyi (strain ATCC 27377 / DSM 6068 / ICPB 4128) TaxID=530564 RepID=D2R529_PIRSD|nr:flagellar export protein FliJ [Pirellula staleyi]ADB18991.1 flagellar export protein FliJ [Pirellula staleyi DSM 6068]